MRAASRNHAAATSCTLSSASRSAAVVPLAPSSGASGTARPKRLRQHPDGLGEADLLVQLDELDHVAADAAAEAVEEALLAVDVERRRLLAVERAQPFHVAPASLERHDVADHLHDVGVQMQIVEEGLREQRSIKRSSPHPVSNRSQHFTIYSLSSTTVTPPPPCSSGAVWKLATSGCDFRNPAIAFLQPSCAVAVNHPHRALIGHERLVQEPLRSLERLVDRAADHVQLRERPFARREIRLHAHAPARSRRRSADAPSGLRRRPAAACR